MWAHIVLFSLTFRYRNFLHWIENFLQEKEVLKKTKDEETVDQNILQKYHRGRQSRFKVKFSCHSRLPVEHYLLDCSGSISRMTTLFYYYFFWHPEFKRQETAGQAQVVWITIPSGSSSSCEIWITSHRATRVKLCCVLMLLNFCCSVCVCIACWFLSVNFFSILNFLNIFIQA